MSTWKDITTDPKTGHTVAKDLYKAQSFYAGLFYLLVLVPGVVLVTPSPIEPGLALVTLAFGLQTLKEVSGYFNRRALDGAAAGQSFSSSSSAEYSNPLPSPPPTDVP